MPVEMCVLRDNNTFVADSDGGELGEVQTDPLRCVR